MLHNKIYYFILFFIVGCADSSNPATSNNENYIIESLNFYGSDNTLDIVTWNIEQYPKHDLTNLYLKEIIDSLNVDIIAIQEIENINAFNELANSLDGWINVFGPNHYGQRNGFLINSNNISYSDPYEILVNVNNEPFTKFPLVLEFSINNQNYILINNHLKCCGDGTIDYNDNGDEEYRRLYSIQLLKEHIDNHFSDEKVIVLGDFNDELIDNENVFEPFLDDNINYLFTDINLATNENEEFWSYPLWPSHIDHILITNELFNNHINTNTILIENALLDIYNYNQFISDHRPVGIKLLFEP